MQALDRGVGPGAGHAPERVVAEQGDAVGVEEGGVDPIVGAGAMDGAADDPPPAVHVRPRPPLGDDAFWRMPCAWPDPTVERLDGSR